MKKLMMILSLLSATTAMAQVDAGVIAEAQNYVATQCANVSADGAFVLESSKYVPVRYDQMMFDDQFIMTYGYRSAHSGSIRSGQLELQGYRGYNESVIHWYVTRDSLGACR